MGTACSTAESGQRRLSPTELALAQGLALHANTITQATIESMGNRKYIISAVCNGLLELLRAGKLPLNSLLVWDSVYLPHARQRVDNSSTFCEKEAPELQDEYKVVSFEECPPLNRVEWNAVAERVDSMDAGPMYKWVVVRGIVTRDQSDSSLELGVEGMRIFCLGVALVDCNARAQPTRTLPLLHMSHPFDPPSVQPPHREPVWLWEM